MSTTSSTLISHDGHYTHASDDSEEDLISDHSYESDGDDMVELSDSHSSDISSSPPTPAAISKPLPLHAHNGKGTTNTSTPSSPPDLFCLATKAERILGIVPGTLTYARASLENARDEVRRTASETLNSVTAGYQPYTFASSSFSSSRPKQTQSSRRPHTQGQLYHSSDWNGGNASLNGNGMNSHQSGGISSGLTRARKAMSIVIPGAAHDGHGRVPNVVVGHGGEEEQVAREKRRKAVDGVLYWQREVARLECEQQKREEEEAEEMARRRYVAKHGEKRGGRTRGLSGDGVMGRAGTLRAK